MKFTAFVRYIRQPSGQMPPYSSKITSETELADIYAFLVSLPHPADPKTIPLLTPPSASEKKTMKVKAYRRPQPAPQIPISSPRDSHLTRDVYTRP